MAAVMLPRLVAVPPRATVVLPSVTELFASKLLGKAVPALLIVTFANVMLLSVVTVFPSWIAVFPNVIGVAKLLSRLDSGIAAVAVPKV